MPTSPRKSAKSGTCASRATRRSAPTSSSARVLSTPSSGICNHTALARLGTRRCFPDIGLANDVLNLQTFYRNYGFYDTKVDTAVVPVGPQRVDIVFRITEGQPLILDSLAISGLDSVPERERILRDPVVKVGERVGPLLVAAQTDTILARLRNNGYPKATAFRAFDTHPSEHRAELGLDVQTGSARTDRDDRRARRRRERTATRRSTARSCSDLLGFHSWRRLRRERSDRCSPPALRSRRCTDTWT